MKRWAIVLAALCLAAAMPAARADAQGFFGRSCDRICNPSVPCRTSCNLCLYWTFDGCGYEYETTCGRAGYPADCRIGYGQGGNIFEGEYCDNLVPHNVNPTPPNYPPAEDGGFSCWYNSPDVICPGSQPLYGYINIRQCFMNQDYGCHDCVIE